MTDKPKWSDSDHVDEEEEKRLDGLRVGQQRLMFFIIFLVYALILFVPIFGLHKEGKGYIAEHAEQNTRDFSAIKWHVVPFLTFTLYMYFSMWEKEKYNKIYAALAFFLWDWFNEVYNSYIHYWTGYSGLWLCNRKESSFMPMVGWNIEIIFNFLICGLISTTFICKNKNKAYFGCINNRQAWAFFGSFLSVMVEIALNKADMLIWNYSWWSATCPWLIFTNGYLVFYEISYYVYDSPRQKQLMIIGGIILFNTILTAIGYYIGYV